MTAAAIAASAVSAPSHVVVSAVAIAANTARMRVVCATPVMAVVKADGFGLGAVAVARAGLAGGASELGVATCEEAMALRAGGITAPVLAWMLYPGAPVVAALREGVDLSCASCEQFELIAAAAAEVGSPARIELECETGMNRSGCPDADWDALCGMALRAQRRGLVEVRGVWTHLGATDDDPVAFADPLRRLDAAWRRAEAAGLRPRRRHAASSLAAVVAPDARLDLVRLGASLLGIEPVADRPVGLEQALRWETTVTQLRRVAADTPIGYGGRYRASRASRVALLPLGYADGIPRAAWPGATVSIRGRRHPVVGAVSMDQCVVDVGDADVAVGDRVVLIGSARAGEPTLGEWADVLDTIPQEVLTRLGPRVARLVEEGLDGDAEDAGTHRVDDGGGDGGTGVRTRE